MLKAVVIFGLVWLTSIAQAQERLIVKFRESGFANYVTAQQIRQEMARPFSQTRMQALSAQARLTLSYSHPIAQSGAHVLRLPQGSTQAQMQAVIDNLKRLPDIAYVEEDKLMRRVAATNDTLYSQLWGMLPVNMGAISYGANFENAWSLTTGIGVVVAIIDTGILPHPDIGTISSQNAGASVGGNLISAGYDFISDCRIAATCPASTPGSSATRTPFANAFDRGDWISASDRNFPPFSTYVALDPTACPVENSSWHGTHVAGTVAAIGNNSSGVVGGAYGAKILPVRVLGKCGGVFSDIAASILWAAGVHGSISNPNPAKVINMSLGAATSSCPASIQDAINAATAAGAVVVVAAGNDDVDASQFAPANCNNVIAVAATARNGSKASYSNFGSLVALAAPGGQGSTSSNAILSTLNTGTTTYNSALADFTYVAYQGTSMAAPHVSAAVALLKANLPAITTTQARAVLQATATSFPGGSTCSTSTCGAGILNAVGVAAVNNSTPTASPDSVNFTQVPPTTTSAAQTVTITNNNPTLPAVFGTSAVITPPAYFSVVSNSCSGASVAAAGGTCTVAVRFAAPTTGQIQGSLGLPMTIGGLASTTVVSLTGTSSQKLTTPSNSVTLPSVLIGANTTIVLTFTNGSGASATTSAASLNPNSIFSIVTDACSNITLANAQTCSIVVRATPTTEGTYSGTLTLNTTGTGDTAVNVTLNGTAITPPPPPSSGGGSTTGLLALLFLLAGLVLSRRYPTFR